MTFWWQKNLQTRGCIKWILTQHPFSSKAEQSSYDSKRSLVYWLEAPLERIGFVQEFQEPFRCGWGFVEKQASGGCLKTGGLDEEGFPSNSKSVFPATDNTLVKRFDKTTPLLLDSKAMGSLLRTTILCLTTDYPPPPKMPAILAIVGATSI